MVALTIQGNGVVRAFRGFSDEAMSVRPDTWIVVGRTTIDGTPVEVSALFDASNLVDDDVFLIRGQYVTPREYCVPSTAAASAEVKVVGCNIVRRLSFHNASATVCPSASASTTYAVPLRPPCPECGPHGNSGEVPAVFRSAGTDESVLDGGDGPVGKDDIVVGIEGAW